MDLRNWKLNQAASICTIDKFLRMENRKIENRSCFGGPQAKVRLDLAINITLDLIDDNYGWKHR